MMCKFHFKHRINTGMSSFKFLIFPIIFDFLIVTLIAYSVNVSYIAIKTFS